MRNPDVNYSQKTIHWSDELKQNCAKRAQKDGHRELSPWIVKILTDYVTGKLVYRNDILAEQFLAGNVPGQASTQRHTQPSTPGRPRKRYNFKDMKHSEFREMKFDDDPDYPYADVSNEEFKMAHDLDPEKYNTMLKAQIDFENEKREEFLSQTKYNSYDWPKDKTRFWSVREGVRSLSEGVYEDEYLPKIMLIQEKRLAQLGVSDVKDKVRKLFSPDREVADPVLDELEEIDRENTRKTRESPFYGRVLPMRMIEPYSVAEEIEQRLAEERLPERDRPAARAAWLAEKHKLFEENKAIYREIDKKS